MAITNLGKAEKYSNEALAIATGLKYSNVVILAYETLIEVFKILKPKKVKGLERRLLAASKGTAREAEFLKKLGKSRS
jgi:hypothetical protein